MIPRAIEIDGKRYVWRDIVTLRRAQLAAVRRADPGFKPRMRAALSIGYNGAS